MKKIINKCNIILIHQIGFPISYKNIIPETMFAIIVYGYMEGIYSTRDLEKACQRDINFRWLLQGQSPPKHNSIDRFKRERLAGCIENLFNQLVKKLRE
ncbi:hypothetical protein ClosIBUN125C_CONTIG10g00835, partial [Clostridium sp. IBUN125C]